MSVAESIVILPPIAQVGCASASSTVTSASSARVRPRKGPPLAVIVRLATAPGGCPAISWCSAVCSESIGRIRAPVASASAVTSSPPTTSDSLLASARSMPSPRAATVGARPAEPTSAFSTRSASDSSTRRTSPSAPASTRPSVQLSAARAAASPSARAIRVTPCARACSSSGCHELSAESPTSSNSPLRSQTSSACRPIEPVEPRMRSRRIGPIIGREVLAGFQKTLKVPSAWKSILSGRVILALSLLILPVVWLVATVLAVAACRAASRADARIDAGASRQGSRRGESPAVRSESSYGLVVSQGV